MFKVILSIISPKIKQKFYCTGYIQCHYDSISWFKLHLSRTPINCKSFILMKEHTINTKLYSISYIIRFQSSSMMIKSVLLITLLFLCTLSQVQREGKVGGYSDVDPASFNSLDTLQDLKRIQSVARQAYSDTNSDDQLLKLTRIQRQVVAGFNYLLDFESKQGDIVQILIFDQSWTQTTEVRSITRTADKK